MADFMDVFISRRSVRNYRDEAVSEDIVNKILDAVKWSPSWGNTQCWEFVWIKDKRIREQMQAIVGKGNRSTKTIVNAPVLFALCSRLGISGYYKGEKTTKFGNWFMYDLGIVTQSLSLAAENFGLGTVIVGRFDHNKAAEILKLPRGIEIVTLIPMGYPAKKPTAPKRREISEFLHIDSF